MLILDFIVSVFLVSSSPTSAVWTPLDPGLDLKWLTTCTPSKVGDSRIAILRIDPAQWELALITPDQFAESTLTTAKEWARRHGLTAAINAGMFATDYVTHVGYMESRGQVRAKTVNGYQSVAAFDLHEPKGTAPFRIFDLDEPGVNIPAIRLQYASLVQNLRLVKKPGRNRWSDTGKEWSEAALGEDRSGRILFVFSRSPFSMRDLNRELLAADIDLAALQHLEGGPEAQMYLKAGSVELNLFGSYETSFREDDENNMPYPIPNVLGIRRKTPVK